MSDQQKTFTEESWNRFVEKQQKLIGAVDEIKDDLTEINNEVDGINNDLTEINNGVDGINNDLTKINNGINGINNDLTKINNDIDGLNTKLKPAFRFVTMTSEYTAQGNSWVDVKITPTAVTGYTPLCVCGVSSSHGQGICGAFTYAGSTVNLSIWNKSTGVISQTASIKMVYVRTGMV